MARANSGIARLLSSMKKMIEEVNDQEICRRLEILMNTEKDDLPPAMIKTLLQNPTGFDPSEVPEPYTQYVKHYLFMIKRADREKERQQMEREKAAREREARQGTASPVSTNRSRRPPARSAKAKKTVASGATTSTLSSDDSATVPARKKASPRKKAQ